MPGAGGQPPQRTTFRPPWVKDGPRPIPMPAAPWTLNSQRDSKTSTDETPAFTKVTLKSVPKPADIEPTGTRSAIPAESHKRSKITIVPSQPKSNKNAGQPPTPTPSTARENGPSEPSSRPQLERQVRVERSRSRGEQIPLSKSESTTGAPTLSKSASRANLPPPPPPRPPPPPPSRNLLMDLPPLTEKQQKTIEMLKSRPRKRPDWACMMKEVESGRKLRHVTCNDRSAPLIERVITKVTADVAGDAHFVFDSEKSNVHNKLLKQIQEGVKLKSVKTNDRSKPMLEGLRKFRRQLTIEEQIQKAEQAPVDEVIPDEMDDIDVVRDDLQSTKQMLALELRNKEALERENKRLQVRILNLEVELERERSQKNVQEHKQQDLKLSDSLKKEAEQARKDAERLEQDFASTAEERDKAKSELEEMKRMYANLEKRMKAACKETSEELENDSMDISGRESEDESNGLENEKEPIVELPDDTVDMAWWDVSGIALAGCPSAKVVARIASQKSMDKHEPEESEEEEEETSDEESEEDEDPKIAEEKRQQREIKLMKTKIKNIKRTEPLEILSCTDKKCPWKRSFQIAMESFQPAPLLQHPCYANKKNDSIEKSQESKKQCIKNISDAQSDHLRVMIYQNLSKCAIAKDASKRHTMKSITAAKGASDSERAAIQLIFQFQQSDLMKKIQDLTTGVLKECCKSILLKLQGNEVEICVETKNFFDAWLKERTTRITGSTCYKVYTYAKNKNPNWKNKADQIFNPKDFKTEATEYGKKAEEEARQVFINMTKKNVIQTGLIVSVQNPWLGYSPDGVILQSGKPHAVLEIKCPVIGKNEGINACIEKCLTMFLVRPKGEENITLKQKHPYYGQVQLGMAVIHVQEAYFVIYLSFKKKTFTLRIKRNETFLMKMLTTLKKSFHEEMLHFLCIKKNQKS